MHSRGLVVILNGRLTRWLQLRYDSRLPGSGCTCLERLAVFYPGCVIIAAVLPGIEDSAVFIVILTFKTDCGDSFFFFHC